MGRQKVLVSSRRPISVETSSGVEYQCMVDMKERMTATMTREMSWMKFSVATINGKLNHVSFQCLGSITISKFIGETVPAQCHGIFVYMALLVL